MNYSQKKPILLLNSSLPPADNFIKKACALTLKESSEPAAPKIASLKDEQVTSTAKAHTVGAVNNDPRSPARSTTNKSFVRGRTKTRWIA